MDLIELQKKLKKEVEEQNKLKAKIDIIEENLKKTYNINSMEELEERIKEEEKTLNKLMLEKKEEETTLINLAKEKAFFYEFR
jgi:hypothetical protein